MRSSKQCAEVSISTDEHPTLSRCLRDYFLVRRTGHLKISHMDYVMA
nr:hypothetical protein [Mycolicibacterium fortuitum]